MATVLKYNRNAQAWDKDKLLSELTAAFGQVPTISLKGGDLEVVVPTGVPTTLCDRVVNTHSVSTTYKPAALVFGGDAGTLDGAGVQVATDAQATNKVSLATGEDGLIMDNVNPSFFWRADTYVGATGTYVRQGLSPSVSPFWQMYYQSIIDQENEIANPTFSTGDFTNWTTGGTGTWEITSQNPKTDVYHARLTQTSAQTATLKSDRMTISSTGTWYEFIFYMAQDANSLGSFSTKTLTVDWYDSPSGGTLTHSDTVTVDTPFAGGGYYKFAKALKSFDFYPEITLTLNRASGIFTSILDIDAFEVRLIGEFGQVSMRPAFALEAQPMLCENLPEDVNTTAGFTALHADVEGNLAWVPNFSTVNPGGGIKMAELYVAPSTPGFMGSGHDAIITYFDRSHNEHLLNKLGQDDIKHRGDYARYSVSPTTSAATMYSTTIKGGSLGTNGQLRFVVDGIFTNQTGGARALTFAYTFGTVTLNGTLSTVSTASTERHRVHIEIITENDASASVQWHIMRISTTAKQFAGSFSAETPTSAYQPGTDNTGSDVTAKLEVTSSGTGTQSGVGTVLRVGPYNK